MGSFASGSEEIAARPISVDVTRFGALRPDCRDADFVCRAPADAWNPWGCIVGVLKRAKLTTRAGAGIISQRF